MGTADKQIRISETVTREIERRRGEGESYNDVLERVFEDDDRDLLAGFGRWDDDHAEEVRRKRAATKQKSKDRMANLGDE